MKASDLRFANKEMRSYILSQAELRLDGQMQFAAAADQRSAMVSGAAIAMATVSFAAAAQVLTTTKDINLGGTATVLGLGFAFAAWFAIRSATCQDFHPGGYYPKNFISDVRSRKAMTQVQAEIAEDLNERLEFNSNVLTRRGRQISIALKIMFSMPIVGLPVFGIITYAPTVIESSYHALSTASQKKTSTSTGVEKTTTSTQTPAPYLQGKAESQ